MIPWLSNSAVEAPALANLLESYRAEALKQMAAVAFGEAPSRAKQELVELLADHLTAPEHIESALAALDPPARQALQRVRRIGRSVDWFTLSEVLVTDGITEVPRLGNRDSYGPVAPAKGRPRSNLNSLVFQDVLARLEIVGLLLGTEPLSGSLSVVDFGSALRYVVPREVARHLSEPEEFVPETEPVVARELRADPEAYSRELYFVWSYIKAHRPKLLSGKGTLSKRDMKALEAELPYSFDVKAVKSEADVRRLYSTRLTLQELGLVGLGPVLEVDEVLARRFWQSSLPGRLTPCLAVRLRAWWLNELQELRDVSWSGPSTGDPPLVGTASKLTRARQAVAIQVGRLGAQREWVALDDLGMALWLHDPAFLNPGTRPQYGYGYSYSSSSPIPSRYNGMCNAFDWRYSPRNDPRELWQLVETQFAATLVTAMGRLGLLDLGFDDESRLTAFRLSRVGRAVLIGEQDAGEREGTGTTGAAHHTEQTGGESQITGGQAARARVIVQPNFRIIALGPLPELALMDLDLVADRVSADRAVEYELTRQSVYRGQQAGVTAERLISWLGWLAAEPIPQNVVRTLEEWQEHHERIVVRVGAELLQAADAETLTELVDASEGALRSLSPQFALVADSGRARSLLSARDIWPVGPDAAAQLRGASLDDDGYVGFRQLVPEIHLLGQVQRLAEWDEQVGSWRVTQRSVRRASSQLGIDAAAQIELWRRVLVDEPPAWLEQRLKAWSGFYGDAILHEVPILELPSDSALEALLDDPEWRERLQLLEHKGPLLRVSDEDIAELRERLADYGIEIVEE